MFVRNKLGKNNKCVKRVSVYQAALCMLLTILSAPVFPELGDAGRFKQPGRAMLPVCIKKNLDTFWQKKCPVIFCLGPKSYFAKRIRFLLSLVFA